MIDKKVWFVTGAGRGMGVDIARAALDAGYRVVATGRDPERVSEAVGGADDLLVVPLDVTDPYSAGLAVRASVDEFGRIDVLVNNAGNFNAGFFEELTAEAFRAQIETTLFGPVNVTCATLPIMRSQRSGLVVTISSTAGIAGGEFPTAYAASKFGIEGWMESLAPEIAPFGIRTMLVEPGFFRTELLTPESTEYAEPSIEDYTGRTEQTVTSWKSMNGQQSGDPSSSHVRWCTSVRWTSRHCGSPPGRMPWTRSRAGPSCFSNRLAPTANCHRRSPTTTPGRNAEPSPRNLLPVRSALQRHFGAAEQVTRSGTGLAFQEPWPGMRLAGEGVSSGHASPDADPATCWLRPIVVNSKEHHRHGQANTGRRRARGLRHRPRLHGDQPVVRALARHGPTMVAFLREALSSTESPSSTPPSCTGPARTSRSSGRRSSRFATRWSSPPSSGSPSTQRPTAGQPTRPHP